MKEFATPQYTNASQIKQARTKLGLTQKEFAQYIGSSKPTVERWEVSEKEITGPIALLARMIIEHPDTFRTYILPEKKLPLRLKYMHQQNLCTLIDVDELRQIVEITNYTTNVMFRAFGVNDTPSYEEFQEFLESRCFPRTRDKMKLVLEDLNLPFFDPLLIIEKTQGRMAEDDFWIEIVR